MYHTSDKVIILTLQEVQLWKNDYKIFLFNNASMFSFSKCTGGGVMMNLVCPMQSLGKSSQIHKGQEFWSKSYFSQNNIAKEML